MTDDGLEPVDVTGRWVGFYRHRWEQLGTYPIIAVLCQNRVDRGQKLSHYRGQN